VIYKYNSNGHYTPEWAHVHECNTHCGNGLHADTILYAQRCDATLASLQRDFGEAGTIVSFREIAEYPTGCMYSNGEMEEDIWHFGVEVLYCDTTSK